ncbi:TPA: plasmid mobilization relaxosome protein MobC [Streptococcus suis]|nr:plasmid mobilization relaxosome protein MobC [Streptococcus suis]HEM6364011.1 plasmid mobilization relaxosome protein MobC [Streptococcus suis]HEM6403754.1 plasmid mobilization relaxosome protein MobC [Streptococcus suis]
MVHKKENRKRYIQKLFRLTPDEDRQIKKNMEQMGVESFQYYAKNQLIHGQLVHIDFPELKALRVAINRIGSNINQIAKQANEDQHTSTEMLEQVLDHLTEIREMVSAKLSSEEKQSLQARKRVVRMDIDEW